MLDNQTAGKTSLVVILLLIHAVIFLSVFNKQDTNPILSMDKTSTITFESSDHSKDQPASPISQPAPQTSPEEQTKEDLATPNKSKDNSHTENTTESPKTLTQPEPTHTSEPLKTSGSAEATGSNKGSESNDKKISYIPPKTEFVTSSHTKATRRWNKETVLDREGISAFLEKGGMVSDLNKRVKTLCFITKGKFCYSNQIADNIEQAVVFAPMYAYYQEPQQHLYDLHTNFLNYVRAIGLKTIVIEAIFMQKKQKYLVTSPDNEPWEIQGTIHDTFYYRENLLNVAAKKTLDYWEYLLWIDAHQQFENIYWWEEAIYKMEHFASVNFFQTLGHMDQSNNTISGLIGHSVMYNYQLNRPMLGTGYFAGNAWGIRKELYLEIGYILDTCIAGGCDYAYCIASMKNIDDWDGFRSFPHYFGQLKPWIENASKVFKGSSAIIRGHIAHFWHLHVFDYFGIQQKIGYCCYDIEKDTYRDANFTLRLSSEQLKGFFPYTNN